MRKEFEIGREGVEGVGEDWAVSDSIWEGVGFGEFEMAKTVLGRPWRVSGKMGSGSSGICRCGTASETLEWIRVIHEFITPYSFLINAHVVNFFLDRLWEAIDKDWIDCLKNEPVHNLLQIPSGEVLVKLNLIFLKAFEGVLVPPWLSGFLTSPFISGSLASFPSAICHYFNFSWASSTSGRVAIGN